jgi:putative membrane protein
MKGLLIRWAILAGVLYLVSKYVPGIHLSGAGAAFLVILALALLNALVRPFLFLFKLFTFPLNFLTLGLFALVVSFLVNILVFWLVGWKGQVIQGFQVDSFQAAFIGAVILAIANAIVSHFIKDRDRD